MALAQIIGWQAYVGDGKMSGTSGKSYRLEGINIKLTSEKAICHRAVQ